MATGNDGLLLENQFIAVLVRATFNRNAEVTIGEPIDSHSSKLFRSAKSMLECRYHVLLLSDRGSRFCAARIPVYEGFHIIQLFI
jgi:hypothetical protein